MSYANKLEHFREVFERLHNERLARLYPTTPYEKVAVEQGYKFDKVFLNRSGEKSGRYMVESRTGNIFGIKSWTQVNLRRQYGSLDIVDDYDWSVPSATPRPGTQAEKDFEARESHITSTHKKRGRKPKASKLVTK